MWYEEEHEGFLRAGVRVEPSAPDDRPLAVPHGICGTEQILTLREGSAYHPADYQPHPFCLGWKTFHLPEGGD